MSILAKKLHILKNGGTEETANIYTTQTECPEPNLKVGVDGNTGYVKLGDVNHQNATKGRVTTTGGTTYAILKTAHQSDFPAAWGEFLSMSFSRVFYLTSSTRNEVRYGWSLHFQNGTLPVLVGLNATTATFDTQWYTTDVKSQFNSAFWVRSRNKLYNAWLTLADGYFEWNVWDNNQWNTADMISTGDAAHWGITTSNYLAPEFTYTITNKVVKVYKNGNLFKTFNV